ARIRRARGPARTTSAAADAPHRGRLRSGAAASSAGLKPGEQIVQALVALVHASLHARGDHAVAVGHGLEAGDRAHQRGAAAFLERRGLEHDVARHTLVLEGLHDGLWRWLAMEDPVEA